jgi:glutathione peroxidase
MQTTLTIHTIHISTVGKQEPDGEEQIEAFCTKNFGVSFPMMAKVEVNGANTHPVYQVLSEKC